MNFRNHYKIDLVSNRKRKQILKLTDPWSKLKGRNKLLPEAIIQSLLLLFNILNLLIKLLTTNTTQVKCSDFLELSAFKKRKNLGILHTSSSQNTTRLSWFRRKTEVCLKKQDAVKHYIFWKYENVNSTLKNPASGPHLSYTLLDLPIAMIIPCILGVIMIWHRNWK